MTTLSTLIRPTQRQNLGHAPLNVNMKEVASIILGGGEGSRLHPLTLTRCKPAINFGGKYRLIDIPISHSIHSNCYKTFILTQFLSSSLHHHIFQTYMQGKCASHPIEILTAEQKPLQKSWFQGTADAIRQNLDYLLECPVDYFLILSGDQIYNINFEEMLSFAHSSNAEIVVSALPVTAQNAMRMGVLKVNQKNIITDFHEKPQDPVLLQSLKSPQKVLESVGISPSSERCFLGSMGIYLFKRKALANLLMSDTRADFGKHLIPTEVNSGNPISAYLYDGYWEDIGTIETFYQANIALTLSHPPFHLHHETRPIFSSALTLPPTKISNTTIEQSILCEGTIIEGDRVTHSILGPRTVIGQGTEITASYIMGNDYYEATEREFHHLPLVPKIGANCSLKRAIIDKNVHIGNNVKLLNKENLTHYDGKHLLIRDGVIIVPRGTAIPDGFIL